MRTEQRDVLASALRWPIAEEERALADPVLFAMDELADSDDMECGVHAVERRYDVVRIPVRELGAVSDHRHDDGAWRFSPRQPLRRFEDAVEQGHAALRHREQSPGRIRETLGVVRVVHDDRWPVSQGDYGDVVARRHLDDELRERLAEERDLLAGGCAVVDEQRYVDRLGRAGD